MNTSKTCPSCGKGTYRHGSALYDYYSCGHAYEKPLNSKETGKMVAYSSPYESEEQLKRRFEE
jgi:hypothetical protein